jgi:alpha/beta superfamily hydrolase
MIQLTFLLLLSALSILTLSDWIAHRLLHPRRQPATRSPESYGLKFEPVDFSSTDGLLLKGWWIPAAPGAPARSVILLHPMFGNRQGLSVRQAPGPGFGQVDLDLLKLAAVFHHEGYAVLLFDFRSHGESQGGLCAGGLTEDQDVVGAVNYVFGRLAIENPQVGLVGFGLGAAAALTAIGRYRGGTEAMWLFSGDSQSASDFTRVPPANIKRLQFLVAVQPASLGTLVRGYLRQIVGPFSRPLVSLASQFCVLGGGFPLDRAALLKFARRMTVPVLYVQARREPWGDCDEVQLLSDATPARTQIWWIDETYWRIAAFEHVVEHSEPVTAFAEQACAAMER